MKVIEKLFFDANENARHLGFKFVKFIITQDSIPIVKLHECTCRIFLYLLLSKNITNILFGEFNEPIFRMVFEELAAVPSEVFIRTRDEDTIVLTEDGRVMKGTYDGIYSIAIAIDVEEMMSGVVKVCDTIGSFAALKNNGQVVTWGDDWCGGDSSKVAGDLMSGVVDIVSSYNAFAALKDNGNVVAWGDEEGQRETVALLHDVLHAK